MYDGPPACPNSAAHLEQVAALVTAQSQVEDEHTGPEDRLDLPFVWVNTAGKSKGKVLTAGAVRQMMAARAGEAGLERKSPHKLRHTYLTELVSAGVGIKAAKNIAGHASIATTQIYVHASRARLEGAAEMLPDVLDVRG